MVVNARAYSGFRAHKSSEFASHEFETGDIKERSHTLDDDGRPESIIDDVFAPNPETRARSIFSTLDSSFTIFGLAPDNFSGTDAE